MSYAEIMSLLFKIHLNKNLALISITKTVFVVAITFIVFFTDQIV